MKFWVVSLLCAGSFAHAACPDISGSYVCTNTVRTNEPSYPLKITQTEEMITWTTVEGEPAEGPFTFKQPTLTMHEDTPIAFTLYCEGDTITMVGSTRDAIPEVFLILAMQKTKEGLRNTMRTGQGIERDHCPRSKR